jgi:universal stress protein A
MLTVRTILHPTDFSDRSRAATQVARALAVNHGARLIMIHVVPFAIVASEVLPPPTDLTPYRDRLERLRAELDGADLKHPVETGVSEGIPADEILRNAEDAGCDLIVMASHGRTGLSRLLMGSVTEAVMRRARCPVLIVKSPFPFADSIPEGQLSGASSTGEEPVPRG